MVCLPEDEDGEGDGEGGEALAVFSPIFPTSLILPTSRYRLPWPNRIALASSLMVDSARMDSAIA